MSVPSIKGSVVVAIVDDLNRALESRRTTREWLAKRLEERELEMLEAPLQPAVWYPIDSYDRLTRALVELEGGSDPESYLRRRGEATAARLRETGFYVQLRRQAGDLDAIHVKLTLSLWGAMVNFSRHTCFQESEDPPVFRVDVEDASSFVPALRTANAGFMEAVFSYLAGRPVSVQIADEERSRFRYRIRG